MKHEPEMDPAFEAELRKTPPAKLDARLLGRLEQTVAAVPEAQALTMHFGWKFWLMPGMAVAALAMILTLKPGPQLSPQTPHKPGARAVAAENNEAPLELFPAHRYNEVASAYEGNIIELPDQQPYRHVRLRVVDTLTWEDPNGPTRVDFTVPRDVHLLIPAEIH